MFEIIFGGKFNPRYIRSLSLSENHFIAGVNAIVFHCGYTYKTHTHARLLKGQLEKPNFGSILFEEARQRTNNFQPLYSIACNTIFLKENLILDFFGKILL